MSSSSPSAPLVPAVGQPLPQALAKPDSGPEEGCPGAPLPGPRSSFDPAGGLSGGRHITLAFIAVPQGVQVHVVLVAPQEQEAEPGAEGVDGNHQQQADDVALLAWHRVEAQVQVDLRMCEGGLGTGPPPAAAAAARLLPAAVGHSPTGGSRVHVLIRASKETLPRGTHGPYGHTHPRRQSGISTGT